MIGSDEVSLPLMLSVPPLAMLILPAPALPEPPDSVTAPSCPGTRQ